MHLLRMALLGTALAASVIAMPAVAQQQPSQQPGLLDQARRLLGNGADDQDAQRRAYEAGRRDEQQRQMDRDRGRRAGDYDARRNYDRSGDSSDRFAPGYGGNQRDRDIDPSYRR